MIDVTSGKRLINKTQFETRFLIATIATNSQQFGTQMDLLVKVNKVNFDSHIE